MIMNHFRTSSEASVTISLGHHKTLKPYNSKTQRLTLPRWSSSGHDKGIHDNEFAGRLDFNQDTEGGITPPISCLKSKAPRHKEMDVYVIQAL